MRWSGGGVSEVDAPIIDAAVGLTKRVQLSASVPHVVGSANGTGAVGGLGTWSFSGKVALVDDSDVKVAVSPLLEVLGAGAVQSLPAGENRSQIGVPVSIEVARGEVRMFAATGVFTRGAWFGGGGAAFQLNPRMSASTSFSRSWAKTDVEGVHRNRSEVAGGVSYFVNPQVAVYRSGGSHDCDDGRQRRRHQRRYRGDFSPGSSSGKHQEVQHALTLSAQRRRPHSAHAARAPHACRPTTFSR